MTTEANAECERRINSIGYYVSVEGKLQRVQEKDFTLTAYTITTPPKNFKLDDVNKVKPKYAV